MATPRRASTAQATHRCMAVGCQHEVQGNFLMCLPHWRQVPKKLRAELWDAYRQIGRRQGGREAHTRALQAAVDAVHTKQVTARARADEQTKPLF